ncbi:MAG: ribonuclease R [Chlamydiae bacterium]|nr:ribonuclease R [Chlamydiota bacterium]
MLKKDKKKFSSEECDIITGTLRMHPKGFGFVIPDNLTACPSDVFIPKHLTDNAVDGDKVEVAINPDSNWEKGPEGKILTILKRGRTHLAGTIRKIGVNGEIIAHIPLLGATRPVVVKPEKNGRSLQVGDRIIMKVLNWGDETSVTECEVSHYIGHISDPSCDIPAVIEEFDLRLDFPKQALQETKSFGTTVSSQDLKNREDFTSLPCFTIDPDTAKDFDDALSIHRDKSDHFHLGVHIADVANYIRANTSLDKEALSRSNSTYFPGYVIPMLPPILSENLCSLKENVVRLTISVMMEFDGEGNLLNHSVCRSYIKSKKRFTYREAKEILDGKKSSPHSKSLKNMVVLCDLLKAKRFSRGSIDFSLPELVIKVDEKGLPLGIEIIEYDITHQLVEEFMLKANEIVARHLEKKGKPLIYRIHESPSPENMEEFFDLARQLGFHLPKKPSQQDLQKLFYKAKNSPFGAQLSVSFIRSMKLAYYSPHNIGHFGLALEHYCHFTSPIRRYSDLIVQRLLFDEENPEDDLEKIASKCSERERISFKAEMSVKVLKKLRLLEKYHKENPTRNYIAVITRIKPFGISFEMQDLFLEGFLHISELENDFFQFVKQKSCLIGKRTGKKHSIGDRIEIRLKTIDLILLESKWELVLKAKKRKAKS